MPKQKGFKGKGYSIESLPEERATHTFACKYPRSLFIQMLEIVNDGDFVTVADFCRMSAQMMIDKINKRDQENADN